MSSDIVNALSRFSETLKDTSMDENAKLKVLRTLNEVPLTLSELSKSGVGRAVKRLKGESGELGKSARALILKWKSILDEHIKKENIVIESPVNKNETPSSNNIIKAGKNIVKKKECEENNSKQANVPFTVNNLYHEQNNSNLFLETKKHAKKMHKLHSLPIKTLTKTVDSDPGVLQSLDSSSGLSFEQSLFMCGNGNSSSASLKKKSARIKRPKSEINNHPSLKSPKFSPTDPNQFTKEILDALATPMENPSINLQVNSVHEEEEHRNELEDDFDGDLKFKSKKILWVPRAKKSNRIAALNGDKNSRKNYLSEAIFEPTSLVNLCLQFLEKSLDLIDHVDKVPYDLFSRVLKKASAAQLSRIERHNPQFKGQTEDLWHRLVQRDFPEHKINQLQKSTTNWSSLYKVISGEQSKRLDRFINQSTKKYKAEKEMRRTTLTTDVIVPSTIRRRAAREANMTRASANSRHKQNTGASGNSKGSSIKMTFQPRNMSRPDPVTVSTIRSNENANTTSDSKLLCKLRKQFGRGR